MAAVTAKRAAKSGAKTTRDAETDPLGHLRAVADDLNEEVAAALKEAEVEVVHRLRTGTRRVEATLETILRQRQGRRLADQALCEPAEAWLGQLKKLRHAAGEVRDLDVHREIVAEELLKAMRGRENAPASEAGANTISPGHASSPDGKMTLREQAERLDGWLAGRRNKRAARLVRKLDTLQPDLRASEQAFLAAAQQGSGRERRGLARDAGLLALEDFLRLVDRMPVLEAANLHEFRKGAKKARYVAEAGVDEPSSKAIGKAIKQVQDDIGDWHDWLVLREEAEQALDAEGAALCERLAAGVAIRFAGAMRTTERMRRRLLGEWLALRGATGRRGPRAERAPAPLKRAGAAY